MHMQTESERAEEAISKVKQLTDSGTYPPPPPVAGPD